MLNNKTIIFFLIVFIYLAHFIFIQFELNITHKALDFEATNIGKFTLKRRCFAPNYTYNDKLAIHYLNQSYKYYQHFFNECPLNDEENFELDNILEITETSLNNNETYQVKLNFMALENYLKKVNQSVRLNNICYFQHISKKSNKPEDYRIKLELDYGEPIFFTSKENATITLKEAGHYNLKCLNERDKEVFEYVYTIWPLNMTLAIESRYRDKQSVLKMIEPFKDLPILKDPEFIECENQNDTNSKRMNVLMIGIDSVSYNNMLRVFPLTYNYLNNELDNNVIFDNYNSIAENTYPNHMGLLCGLKDPEMTYLYSLVKNHTHHDHFPFIWKQFERQGYLTMFYLDFPEGSMLHNSKHGFLYKPTDFYNRAFSMKLSKLSNPSNKICYGKMPLYRIYFDKIEEFVTRMNSPMNKGMPYFSLTFQVDFTHDFLSPPPGADKRMRDMIKKLYSKGYLNDTMLIIYSDHGNRLTEFSAYTEIGRYERSRPFLSIRLPNEFKNSVYMKNLENNRHKLATHFDLYQTLQHYSVLNKYKFDLNSANKENSESCRKQFRTNYRDKRNNRGVSLFEELSKFRTCAEAMIDYRYCRCYNKMVPITKDEFKINTGYNFNSAIDIILNKLNNMIDGQKNLCMPWKFHSLDALNIKAINNDFIIYEAIIIVEPGKATFEVNLHLDANKELKIKEDPTRLNLYLNQAKCIKIAVNKNYCYCKISYFKNRKNIFKLK